MKSHHSLTFFLIVACLWVAGCSDDDGARPTTPVPNTYLVKPDGSGDYPDIQAAVRAASDGDTVLLASGTFNGPGNRDVNYLGKQITIRSQTGHPSAVTIDCKPDDDGGHRGFYFHSGEGPQAVLEAMTIINGSISGGGGGVSVDSSSSPTIRNVVFRENATLGLMCRRSSPTIEQCTFTFNSPRGGMECYAESAPVLRDCMFTHNYSDQGGAGFAAYYSAPTLEHCVFWDNESRLGGGGMQIGIASETGLGEFSVNFCTFTENVGGLAGGGLLIGATDGVVENCLFVRNRARDGGGIYCGQDVSATIKRTTIVSNAAQRGAGIWLYSRATASINNSIVAFNLDGTAVDCDSIFGPSDATLFCCDVYGNDGGDWVDCLEGQLGSDGNISVDPLFCDLEAGNLLLQSNSPCVNDSCGVIGLGDVGCAPKAAEKEPR